MCRTAMDISILSECVPLLAGILEHSERADEAKRIMTLHNAFALEESLDLYREQIQHKRNGPYMEFPSHVHMETMAKCNAACVFCPYPTLERQGEIMSDALVAKIISDLTDIPRGLKFQLSPFKVNEPFLDVRLFDILRTINDKLPNAALTLTTNASPVTQKNLDQLSTVKNLEELWISFNDHRPAEYEATMKIPYKRTIERLDAIHARVAAGDFPFKVVLSRVGDGSTADEAFKQWTFKHYPAFYHSVIQRGAWIGQVEDIDQNVPNVGCSRWFELSITATGVVAHCCMDGQAKWPIGDVNSQHVLEVYNNPHYRQLREQTVTRLDATPCNQCAFL